MSWDLGVQGLLLLAAISAGSAVLAALLVGGGWARRLWAVAVTAVTSFGVGLLTSEWLFGWATGEDLQPTVDGLSRDEVVLSSLVVTVVVVLIVRYAARRVRSPRGETGRHAVEQLPGRHRGEPARHA